jgi:flagellar protein FlaG
MENNTIDPVAGAAVASRDIRSRKEPMGTLVIKSTIDEIRTGNDAEQLLSKADESRLEAGKSLDMIRDRLMKISESLNEDMELKSKSLKFSVDEITNRLLVTVSDKESGKVIKQIPSDRILEVAHSLEALKGLLYDNKY